MTVALLALFSAATARSDPPAKTTPSALKAHELFTAGQDQKLRDKMAGQKPLELATYHVGGNSPFEGWMQQSLRFSQGGFTVTTTEFNPRRYGMEYHAPSAVTDAKQIEHFVRPGTAPLNASILRDLVSARGANSPGTP
jgi:hypothetical protein